MIQLNNIFVKLFLYMKIVLNIYCKNIKRKKRVPRENHVNDHTVKNRLFLYKHILFDFNLNVK